MYACPDLRMSGCTVARMHCSPGCQDRKDRLDNGMFHFRDSSISRIKPGTFFSHITILPLKIFICKTRGVICIGTRNQHRTKCLFSQCHDHFEDAQLFSGFFPGFFPGFFYPVSDSTLSREALRTISRASKV
jgi:hypothetical protein